MEQSFSKLMPSGRGNGADRRDWSLFLGVIASVLALAYLVAAFHARDVVNSGFAESKSIWFPLELFLIAVSPALAGFIFLWSERRLRSSATQKFIGNIGIFGFGMALAAWVAFVIK